MSKAPQLRIVTGKGGVGKTSVATALALAAARNGERVLLAEMSGQDRIAHLLNEAPDGAEVRQIQDRLFLVDIRVPEAIREYVLLTLKSERLFKPLFENRFMRTFLKLVPALGHLVTLGKVWFHAHEKVKGHYRFDRLILDAPATGHAQALLKTPSIVEAAIPPGPLRENARKIQHLLLDHNHTAVQIVTTPEEMPVAEALELHRFCKTLKIATAPLVINERLSGLPDRALDLLELDPSLTSIARALAHREKKRTVGEEALAALSPDQIEQALSLPYCSGKDGLDLIESLAQLFLPSLPHEEPRQP